MQRPIKQLQLVVYGTKGDQYKRMQVYRNTIPYDQTRVIGNIWVLNSLPLSRRGIISEASE